MFVVTVPFSSERQSRIKEMGPRLRKTATRVIPEPRILRADPVDDSENLDPNQVKGLNAYNLSVLSALDPEIMTLCDELESLGGGIKTRLKPIRGEITQEKKINQLKRQIDISMIDGRLDLDIMPELLGDQFTTEFINPNFSQTMLIFKSNSLSLIQNDQNELPIR